MPTHAPDQRAGLPPMSPEHNYLIARLELKAGATAALSLRASDLPIPPALWQARKQRGLIDERAPVEEGA